MFCSKCGKENPDDAKFCVNCQAPLGEAPAAVPAEPAQPAAAPEAAAEDFKKPGLASLICALNAIVLLIVLNIIDSGYLILACCIAAFVLSIVAIANSARSKKIKRNGLAVAGLVIGIIALVWAAIYLAVYITCVACVGACALGALSAAA